MPQVSHLAEIIPASPIRKLVPFADAAKARGTKVYHLNIGQPDIETPDVALRAIRNLDDKVLEYTHSAGIESYRRRLAEFYNKRSLGITHENILITTGGSEAILMALLTICNPGDQIIIPEPFYANYNSFAMEAGVEIVTIKARIETGFALPPISEFEKEITPKTRAILICNPNNPTGYLYSQQEIEQLRDLVVRHNLFLMADEVYSDFCYDSQEHYSVLRLKGVEQNVIMIDSVSKRYSMCGARVGALITRNAQVSNAVLKICQARLCSPLLGQIAASAAIDTPDSYFEAVKAEYVARRNYCIGALQKMKGVTCPMPSGAFYAIASLPVDDTNKFAQWLLEEYQYNGATVMLAPASGFYNDPTNCPQNQVRIAYVLKIEDLQKAMEILEHALLAYADHK